MNSNVIHLSLPLNPAYLSTIRLTSASLCERMNFNLSEIEDVKTALSETATCIIKKCSLNECKVFDIAFEVLSTKLNVTLTVPSSNFNFSSDETDLAYKLIKGCMDDVLIKKDDSNNKTTINLIKLK